MLKKRTWANNIKKCSERWSDVMCGKQKHAEPRSKTFRTGIEMCQYKNNVSTQKYGEQHQKMFRISP